MVCSTEITGHLLTNNDIGNQDKGHFSCLKIFQVNETNEKATRRWFKKQIVHRYQNCFFEMFLAQFWSTKKYSNWFCFSFSYFFFQLHDLTNFYIFYIQWWICPEMSDCDYWFLKSSWFFSLHHQRLYTIMYVRIVVPETRAAAKLSNSISVLCYVYGSDIIFNQQPWKNKMNSYEISSFVVFSQKKYDITFSKR